MAQECGVCTQPVGDQATVCTPCTGLLTRNLKDLPELADDLETTMSRQDRLAYQSDGGRSSEQPLYWKEAAGDTLRLIRAGLRQWVSHYLGFDYGDTDHPVPTLTRNLLNAVAEIRQSDDGPRMAVAMREAVREARRVVDKPPDRKYLGPCGIEDRDESLCSEELFARPADETVTCRACGRQHSIDARLEFLNGEVADQLVTAAMVAGILVTTHNVTVTTSMIRGYEARGRLLSKGRDRGGKKTYRIGDVMDILADRDEDKGFNISA